MEPFELRYIAPGTPEYEQARGIRYECLYGEWNLPHALVEDTDGLRAALPHGRHHPGDRIEPRAGTASAAGRRTRTRGHRRRYSLRPDLVWVAGAITAFFGLASVGGNALVGRVTSSSWGRVPARLLARGAVANAVGVAALGLLGVLTPEGGSPAAFAVMVLLFGLFGVVSGVMGPVRQAFLNEHIPSAQRATVLSLDSFFGDVGGSIGQPGFGWIARTFSIPVGYLVGALAMGFAWPLYRLAGRSAKDDAKP